MQTLIAAAPTGARRTKADHPRLPVTPDEIARDAKACRDAGAAMLHLHVRDSEGRHSLDTGLYHEAMAAVKEMCGDDLVVQITTEAVGRSGPEAQIALIKTLKPEAVSIALREVFATNGAELAANLLPWMKAEGIWPQFILYDDADVTRLCALLAQNAVPFERPFVLYVLGRHTRDQQSAPEDLAPFLMAAAGRNFIWQVCAFGRCEHRCMEAAIAQGGHVRVGFENNLHLPDGRMAKSNADLVRLAAMAAAALGREPMTAGDLRRLMQDGFR